MKGLKPQTPEESDALNRALSAMREEWSFAPSMDLQRLVVVWYLFVHEVTAGYESHPAEYGHFLELRDELDKVTGTLPYRMQRAIDEVVRPADEEYLSATDTTDDPILPADDSEQLHERWYRIPKLLTGDFLDSWHRPGLRDPYTPDFPAGSSVQIADRDSLEGFARTWKYHHPLQTDQLTFAGMEAVVESVGYYHGGDQLYTLTGIPGLWHPICLRRPYGSG